MPSRKDNRQLNQNTSVHQPYTHQKVGQILEHCWSCGKKFPCLYKITRNHAGRHDFQFWGVNFFITQFLQELAFYNCYSTKQCQISKTRSIFSMQCKSYNTKVRARVNLRVQIRFRIMDIFRVKLVRVRFRLSFMVRVRCRIKVQ